MQSRLLKLSMYTLYGKRKKPIYFQRSNFKVTGPLQKFWHLDLCGQDIARTMQSRLLKRSMYTSYGSGTNQLKFKVKEFGHLGPCLDLFNFRD